jgi:hypothetical protein
MSAVPDPDACTSVYINPKDDGGDNGGGGDGNDGSIVDTIKNNPAPVVGALGLGAMAWSQTRGE